MSTLIIIVKIVLNNNRRYSKSMLSPYWSWNIKSPTDNLRLNECPH